MERWRPITCLALAGPSTEMTPARFSNAREPLSLMEKAGLEDMSCYFRGEDCQSLAMTNHKRIDGLGIKLVTT
jgi:hypothetical protein